MNKSSVRACEVSSAIIRGHSTPISAEALRRSAIVFAPHPDDETLGCGGTILKKRQVGAKVSLCFLTSGGGSHSDLISSDDLEAIRYEEALKAGGMLGVAKNSIAFLGLPDSKLSKNVELAIEKVRAVILAERPEEIFVPSQYEPVIEDHSVSNKIIMSALKTAKINVVVNEYPIWLWYHFPWVRAPSLNPKAVLGYLRRSVISESVLFRKFRSYVFIGDVSQQKCAVMDNYRSQISRLFSRSDWRSLKDIGDGEFINCFFQAREVFFRYNA